MINIEKLLESKRVEVSFLDSNVDKNFVKSFRKEHQLTQVALANILGVTKKTIEKWEQGVNNVNGSSAVLLRLLNNNNDLLHQLYSVRYDVEGKPKEDNYQTIACNKVVTNKNQVSKSQIIRFPLVAML